MWLETSWSWKEAQRKPAGGSLPPDVLSPSPLLSLSPTFSLETSLAFLVSPDLEHRLKVDTQSPSSFSLHLLKPLPEPCLSLSAMSSNGTPPMQSFLQLDPIPCTFFHLYGSHLLKSFSLILSSTVGLVNSTLLTPLLAPFHCWTHPADLPCAVETLCPYIITPQFKRA